MKTLAIIIAGIILLMGMYLRSIILEIQQVPFIRKLLNGNTVKAEAEISKVNVISFSKTGIVYGIKYYFLSGQNNYIGSSCVSMGFGHNQRSYEVGDKINILYLKDSPIINAYANNVTGSTLFSIFFRAFIWVILASSMLFFVLKKYSVN